MKSFIRIEQLNSILFNQALENNYRQLKEYNLVIYAVNHEVYKENKKEIINNSALFYDLVW